MRVLICGPLATSGGVSTHTKKLAENLRELGVSVILFSFTPRVAIEGIGAAVVKLYRRTVTLSFEAMKRRNEYDIMHIQASGGLVSFAAALTGCLMARIGRKRTVVTFHYSNTEAFINKHRILFGIVLGLVDRMIVVSEKQRSEISRRLRTKQGRVVVIPNGYDESLFHPLDRKDCRRRLGIPEDKKVIFNVSNLVDHKGHRYLVEAIAKVVSSEENMLCIIAGRGPARNDLDRIIRQAKLADTILMIGWIPDEEVPVWINASDFFVHPSLAEAMPVVMFESLACGTPFLGTRVGGIPEIVNSMEYGSVFDPANSVSLAQTITTALHKDWDRKAISEYATRFSWTEIATSTKAVYQTIVECHQT